MEESRKRHEGDLPLQGLVVLDLTRTLPGPYCTMLLGDYGADVIKVEDLYSGDPSRAVGRFDGDSGSLFRQLNRNKKSIALDLKSADGREIVERLAARADILAEGFRPGVMERLGLGYEQLKSINTGLIYASISGYGQDGVYRERAGHDLNYTALSGLLDLSAEPEGQPVMPAAQIADVGGSLLAISGLLMALYRRGQSGQGCHIDIAMTRGLLSWLPYAAAHLGGDEALPRRDRSHLTGAYACYNVYETAGGGAMSLGALEPVFWQRFCETVGRPDLIPLQFDPEQREELICTVRALFKQKRRKEWEEIFSGVDACCEPVLELNEALGHHLAREEGCWVDYRTADGVIEKLAGFPLLFCGRPGKMSLPPPRHGEHTREVLALAGYSEQKIEALKSEGRVKIS